MGLSWIFLMIPAAFNRKELMGISIGNGPAILFWPDQNLIPSDQTFSIVLLGRAPLWDKISYHRAFVNLKRNKMPLCKKKYAGEAISRPASISR
jgi:hypothetical protein